MARFLARLLARLMARHLPTKLCRIIWNSIFEFQFHGIIIWLKTIILLIYYWKNTFYIVTYIAFCKNEFILSYIFFCFYQLYPWRLPEKICEGRDKQDAKRFRWYCPSLRQLAKEQLNSLISTATAGLQGLGGIGGVLVVWFFLYDAYDDVDAAKWAAC